MTLDTLSYISGEGWILIPVLYIIGMILKSVKKIPDRYIPIILLAIGVGLSQLLLGAGIESVIQGILLTGITVYGNQVVKQLQKNDED